MIIYLQSIDYDLQVSIENRPIKVEYGIEIAKARNEYYNNDKKLLSMNAKAMNTLYCALCKSEFNRITLCKNTRDIWHAL
jgi:hypothetical protein